ncbi:hypothetical protein BX600DRAFT_507931 [Xylariales sp. PMI_506]|nr:hypothetical protein BX600DRAFT_507931 [Xylariales sp. PMI_506]
MTSPLSGPGILYVESKISDPRLDEKTYVDWYENEHIPEVIGTSGIKSARRFKTADPNVDKPFLAIYTLGDLAFLKSDEFRKVNFKSDKLPGSGIIYDLADFDVRYDSLIQVYDPTNKGNVSAQIEQKETADLEDFDKWYREEHLGLLSKAAGYLRTTRYKLSYARTNAQSRVLKGLATESEAGPEPPTWLAIHEFEVEDVDLAALGPLTASPWTTKIHAERKLGIFRHYKLVNSFAGGEFFNGVEA